MANSRLSRLSSWNFLYLFHSHLCLLAHLCLLLQMDTDLHNAPSCGMYNTQLLGKFCNLLWLQLVQMQQIHAVHLVYSPLYFLLLFLVFCILLATTIVDYVLNGSFQTHWVLVITLCMIILQLFLRLICFSSCPSHQKLKCCLTIIGLLGQILLVFQFGCIIFLCSFQTMIHV